MRTTLGYVGMLGILAIVLGVATAHAQGDCSAKCEAVFGQACLASCDQAPVPDECKANCKTAAKDCIANCGGPVLPGTPPPQ